MVRIMTWNTLESGEGGAFSNGWGCPLEIARRDELRKVLPEETTVANAEAILTHERHGRLRRAIREEFRSNPVIDFMVFQEVTIGDAWDENNNNKSDTETDAFFREFGSAYERVPCPPEGDERQSATLDDNLRRVYVRKDTGWTWKRSHPLESSVLSGGCLVEFVHAEDGVNQNNEQQSLFLVNLHGNSRDMRDPRLRRSGLSGLWNEIDYHLGKDTDNRDIHASWKDRIVLCGDWNTQLTDLVDDFRNITHTTAVNTEASSNELEPVVGLLDNSTRTSVPFFSTNHEDGFLAQYDGCLFFSSPFFELEGTSWNPSGFMPKGHDGNLTGGFRYHHHQNSNDEDGVYLNGVFLPESLPSMGLSDHLRIYTDIRIHMDTEQHNHTNIDSHAAYHHEIQQEQRRPLRDYSMEGGNGVDDTKDGGNNKDSKTKDSEDKIHNSNGNGTRRKTKGLRG